MSGWLYIKNWENYQHYKDRCPPWVKLHTEILTSRTWIMVSDASKLLAVASMMLASKHNGKIPHDEAYIQRAANLENRPDFKELIENDFFVLADASIVQANAIIEERREEERRYAKDASNIPTWVPIDDWNDYLDMRKRKKKEPTERALGIIINKLSTWRNAGYDVGEVLRNSTVNNWTDVYEPKGAPPLKPNSKVGMHQLG